MIIDYYHYLLVFINEWFPCMLDPKFRTIKESIRFVKYFLPSLGVKININIVIVSPNR
jgi:hypothetical protein